MNKKNEKWIHRDYDHKKQAYILDRYINGILVCTYTAYLNHRTRTFKCYPRKLLSFESVDGISFVHENEVKQQI